MSRKWEQTTKLQTDGPTLPVPSLISPSPWKRLRSIAECMREHSTALRALSESNDSLNSKIVSAQLAISRMRRGGL